MTFHGTLPQAMTQVSLAVRQGRRVSIARHLGIWWVKTERR